MININIQVCKQLREARRAAKLSQSEVANEVGCNQSALSMFEQGQITKLNDEAVEKIARKFGIDLKGIKEERVQIAPPIITVEKHSAFCPNPKCPTNHRYEVEGRVMYLPDREKADPIGGRFCAMCGEVLERKCPNCGSPVHAGGICSVCGEAYVAI